MIKLWHGASKGNMTAVQCRRKIKSHFNPQMQNDLMQQRAAS
jgi:hypothetical protein